jgi:hypothetical protein
MDACAACNVNDALHVANIPSGRFQRPVGIFAAALLASGVLALALTSRAEAGDARQVPAARKSESEIACERARLSAWFARQRELTDGAFDPFPKVETPR